jgi:hypothetical protein
VAMGVKDRVSLRSRRATATVAAILIATAIGAFEFAPGTAATVRVWVRRGKRRSIKRTARRGDVKLRARAKTSSGKAARTLRLRASS